MLRIVHVEVCGLFAAFFLLHFPAFVANLGSSRTSLSLSMSTAIPSSSLPSFVRGDPDIVDFNELRNQSRLLPLLLPPRRLYLLYMTMLLDPMVLGFKVHASHLMKRWSIIYFGCMVLSLVKDLRMVKNSIQSCDTY